MSKTYYKVLTPDLKSVNEVFHKDSAFLGGGLAQQAKDLVVQYGIGQLTKPKLEGTALMVFDSLDAVNDFMIRNSLKNSKVLHGMHRCRVFEVEVQHPRRQGLFVYQPWWSSYFQDFFEVLTLLRRKKKYRNRCNTYCPKGTVFCSAVKLVREVK